MNDAGGKLGPYRIEGKVGRGATSTVYRAEDCRSGRRVALKLLEQVSEAAKPAMRREIHALSRLEHPGIVRILDSGVEQGVPWYAMELIEGQTLGRLWADAPASGAPALGVVLTLVRRLCAPLAYLHGEGIVHRDLKPDNILLRAASSERPAASEEPEDSAVLTAHSSQLAASYWPVLVDFGLVSRFTAELSREALEPSGAVSGTVEYMAPEQLLGELLDARADLYSLGCILYELLTGRTPFEGNSAAQVAQGHLKLQPRPPSELRDGVPPQLDALVLQLLAKRPRDRLGHAGDVAAVLAGLGAEAGLACAEPKPKSYLYRPALAGRSADLETLLRHLSKLGSGQGGLVLVGGESGVGKTLLVMELGREARRRRLRVLTGDCAAEGGPLHAFGKSLQALADRCHERGEDETERLLGRRGKVLAQYEPELVGLPGQERHPEPAELDPKAARLRLFSDLAAALAALAEERPLLLLLDDLQWADELSLGFLAHVLRCEPFERMRLLVVGAYRSEEAGVELEELLRAQEVDKLQLRRLDQESIGTMIQDMLALASVPELFVRFVARQSEGNPFFVAEYLRAAVGEELLYRDALGRWQAAGAGEEAVATEELYEKLPLPGSLRALVGRRLGSLSAAARHLAGAASVLGREVDEILLVEMVLLGPADRMEAIEELLRRQVLEEMGSGHLRFVHDKLREVAYEHIDAAEQRGLHRAAARAIETQPERERERYLGALGYHWERAGDAEKARTCYLTAARQRLDTYALVEAEQLYRASLRLTESPTPESVKSRNELGKQVLRAQGRNLESLHEQQAALNEARRIGDRSGEAASLTELSILRMEAGQTEEACELAEQALNEARQLGDQRSIVRCLSCLAVVKKRQGRTDEARSLTEQALVIARETGEERLETHILLRLAGILRALGQYGEAQQRLRQALAIGERTRDQGDVGTALNLLGVLGEDTGQIAAARSSYRQALAVLRGSGDRPSEGRTMMNLGYLEVRQGHLDEADALHRQAIEILRAAGDRPVEGQLLGNWGNVYQARGQLQEARALYQQALAIAGEVGDRSTRCTVLCDLGLLGYEEGRLDEAAEVLSEALELAREMNRPKFQALAQAYLAGVARRRGQMDEAGSLGGLAERVLRSLADRLDLGGVLCEQGHLALAQGQPARALLEEAGQVAASLALGPRSALSVAIERLGRAQHAFEAGERHRLYGGELIDELPQLLRQRLAERGELPAAAAGTP